MKDIKDTIFRKKPLNMLICLYKNKQNLSQIAKEVDVTYSHVNNIFNFFEKENLVIFEKQGRNKFVTLTKKGNEIVIPLIELDNMLK